MHTDCDRKCRPPRPWAASSLVLLRQSVLAVCVGWLAIAWPAAHAADETPAETLALLEERLLESDEISIEFSIVASGAVKAELAGSAALAPPADTAITADGTFAGQPAQIRLAANPLRIIGGNGDVVFDQPMPLDLKGGLILGLTRMGLLHNLAVMSGGSPPDATAGQVREWIQYQDVQRDLPEAVGGQMADPYRFKVIVSGVPSAVATLWLDSETGLPVQRSQTVSFETGDMIVLERYSKFVVSPGP